MRHTNAAVRKALTWHYKPCMHTDSALSQTHPVGHLCTLPLTSGRNRMFARIGILYQHISLSVQNATEPAGEMFFLFFQDSETPLRSGFIRRTCRHGPIHGNLAIYIQAGTLL